MSGFTWGGGGFTWPEGGFSGAGVPVTVMSLDFTALTPGDASSAYPFSSFSRSSSGASAESSSSTIITGIAANKPRGAIMVRGASTYRGLMIEGASDARLPAAAGSWSTPATGGTSTGPDGNSTARTMAASAGGVGAFHSSSTLWQSGHTMVLSFWAKVGSGASAQLNLQDSGNHSYTFTPGASWERFTRTLTASQASGLLITEGRNIGAGTLAQNWLSSSWMLSSDVEHSFASSAPAGDHCADVPISALLRRGRVRVVVSWIALVSHAALVASGATSIRIVGNNGGAIDLNLTRRTCVVTAAGGRAVLSGTYTAWSQWDTLTIDVTCGGGFATGALTTNAVTESLGTSEVQPRWVATSGAAIQLFADGTSAELWGLVQSIRVDDIAGSGARASVEYFASPSGSGAGTYADPASLTSARSLARAAAAAGRRPRVWLRGGTYALAAVLAFDSGDDGCTYAAFPGEVPVLSGGTALTFTDNGDGTWRATLAAKTRGVWVGVGTPTRPTRARSAILNGAGWTRTATGWTASSASDVNVANPAHLRIITSGTWRWYDEGVTSVASTTVTCPTADHANLIYENGPTDILWLEGCLEFLSASSAGSWVWIPDSGGKVAYKPRSGEATGTVTAYAGAREQLLTIDGASNVRFENIEFRYTTWNRPDSAGGFCVVGGSLINGGTGENPSHPFDHLEQVGAAVTLTNCDEVTFSGCTFANLGGGGVRLDAAAKRAAFRSCIFFDIAGPGLFNGLYTYAHSTLAEADWVDVVDVVDCLFSDTSHTLRGSSHVELFYASNVRILHCYGDTCSYSPWSLGFGLHVQPPADLDQVANNEIAYCYSINSFTSGRPSSDTGYVTTWLRDGGSVVYIRGRQRDLFVHHNYGSGLSAPGTQTGGLYVDAGSGGESSAPHRFEDNVIETGSGSGWGVVYPGNSGAATDVHYLAFDRNYYNSGNTTAWNYIGGSVQAYDSGTVSLGTVTTSIAGGAAQAIIAAAGRY